MNVDRLNRLLLVLIAALTLALQLGGCTCTCTCNCSPGGADTSTPPATDSDTGESVPVSLNAIGYDMGMHTYALSGTLDKKAVLGETIEFSYELADLLTTPGTPILVDPNVALEPPITFSVPAVPNTTQFSLNVRVKSSVAQHYRLTVNAWNNGGVAKGAYAIIPIAPGGGPPTE